MSFLRILPWAGWVAALATGALWLNARDAIIEAQGDCDTATVQAALDAERVAHNATKENYEQLVVDLQAQAKRNYTARVIAEEALADANKISAGLNEDISRLELESEHDEIPDSRACLNAYVLRGALDGVRLQTEHCAGGSSGSRPGASSICGSPAALGQTNSTARDFSTVTYGDALKIWGKDRHTIRVLNGQLRAIEALSGETTNVEE